MCSIELFNGAAVRMFLRPSFGTASRGDWWMVGIGFVCDAQSSIMNTKIDK